MPTPDRTASNDHSNSGRRPTAEGYSDCGLRPELADLVRRTHRGVHLLTYLKREELAGSEKGALFDRAAEDARAVQIEALGTDRSGGDS